jgi:hypothetical protein
LEPRLVLSFRWEGEGVDEIGKEKDTGIVRVKINPKYYRPAEVVRLLYFAHCDPTLFNPILNPNKGLPAWRPIESREKAQLEAQSFFSGKLPWLHGVWLS